MITKPKYRSLDLLKGLAKGWDEQHSLGVREVRVLTYVAQHGRQNEGDHAFVWHPMKGLEWWAEDMSMPFSTLYRVLGKLRSKGLLMETPKTDTWRCKGYGIPSQVMAEILTHEKESVSRMRMWSLTHENPAPPLTCGDEVHNQGTNQHTKQLLTQPPSSTAGSEEGSDVNDWDDWAAPKDEADDWDVPAEAKAPKAKRTVTPQTRLMREFKEQWSLARCRNTAFGVAYNNQGVVLATFKRLLGEYSEDDLSRMIVVFFDQAAAGRLRVSGNEMWRDFLNSQAEVWRIVSTSGTVLAPMDEDVTEHNEAVAERRRQRREERALREARTKVAA